MKRLMSILLLMLLFTSSAFAVDVAPRISDREIIEKLSALDAKIDREIANVRGDIKELKAGQEALQQQIADTNRRIDDLKESNNIRFDDINKRLDTLQWMLGLFITVALSLMAIIGRILWIHQKKLTQIETSLEAQKEEISFLKILIEKLQTLIEKLLPPRGVL